MLNICQVALAAILLSAANLKDAAAVSHVAKSSQALGSAPTCPSQSINYITQTLPQQCLATKRIEPSYPIRATNGSGSFNGNAIASQSTASDQKTDGRSVSIATATTPTVVEPTLETVQASIASADASAQSVADQEQESEADPFSDKGNFLSFEEWKKQMLEKAGQSPEYISSEKTGIGSGQNRRRPGDINNALDTLGDDSEIELDFGGFVNDDNAPRPLNVKKKEQGSQTTRASNEDGGGSENRLTRKSKDAGTTCKERFNYASFDCAATVLKTNTESRGSTSVLVENKDSYMLNPCKVNNKFFIVELCSDILIDTVVLANFEFFSSTFRTFRVSVSDRYPVKAEKWKELGTFEARNTREVQPFLVENGLIFARYLRFEFLTHYGVEYYCPVSLLRVHGKTMMDDFNEFRANRGDEDAGEDAAEVERDEMSDESENAETAEQSSEVADSQMKDLESSILDNRQALPTAVLNTTSDNTTKLNAIVEPILPPTRKDLSIWVSYDSPLFERHHLVTKSCDKSVASCHFQNHDVLEKATIPPISTNLISKTSSTSTATSGKPEPREPATLPSQPVGMMNNSSVPGNKTEMKAANHTNTQSKQSTNSAITQSPPSTKITPSQNPHSTKTTPTTPPASTPSTQESFFKSIAKRLQHLEQNSTLSLQYIEEQSRLLREAFTKVEKRQLSKTSTFLETLNTTVQNELRDFRILYDQMWQSTVLELSSQRQASQHEIVALSARLSILADEILFQKRMMVVQFFLILICLALFLFERMSPSAGVPAYADLQSAVRDVVSKPSVHLSRYLNLESPPGSPGTRPVSRYGFFSGRNTASGLGEHTRSASSESTAIDDATKSAGPTEAVSPTEVDAGALSPEPEEDDVAIESPGENEGSQSPEAQQAALLRSWSSPEMGSQLRNTTAGEETPDVDDTVSRRTSTMDSLNSKPTPHEDSEDLASRPNDLIPPIDPPPGSSAHESESNTGGLHR